MSRPSPLIFFKQSLKSESIHSDELINIYVLRPIASAIVWLVYPTRITPNQLTTAALCAGIAASWVYTANTPIAIAGAGLLVTLKDVLDDADGQLARAKSLYSRRGRFLDSIGDFIVNVFLFAALTAVVYRSHPAPTTIVLGALSFLGITLRVSYHVFYQVSFLHLESQYKFNRIVEEITEEDRRGDPVALRLQKIFLLMYGWQDWLMHRIDLWCRGTRLDEKRGHEWYNDRLGLRISGLLGFGTEYAVLTICSLLNDLPLYLLLNVLLMNGIWTVSIVYRKMNLAHALRAAPHNVP